MASMLHGRFPWSKCILSNVSYHRTSTTAGHSMYEGQPTGKDIEMCTNNSDPMFTYMHVSQRIRFELIDIILPLLECLQTTTEHLFSAWKYALPFRLVPCLCVYVYMCHVIHGRMTLPMPVLVSMPEHELINCICKFIIC